MSHCLLAIIQEGVQTMNTNMFSQALLVNGQSALLPPPPPLPPPPSLSLARASIQLVPEWQVAKLEEEVDQRASEGAVLRSKQVHQEHLEGKVGSLQEELSQLQGQHAEAQARVAAADGLQHANTKLQHEISKAHLEMDHLERKAAAAAQADSLHSQVRLLARWVVSAAWRCVSCGALRGLHLGVHQLHALHPGQAEYSQHWQCQAAKAESLFSQVRLLASLHDGLKDGSCSRWQVRLLAFTDLLACWALAAAAVEAEGLQSQVRQSCSGPPSIACRL